MSTWELYDDPRPFAEAARPYLAANPLTCTVITSMVDRLLTGERQPLHHNATPFWFAARRDETGQVEAVAMRSGDWPPYLQAVDAAAATELAGLVIDRGERPRGANGSPAGARAFCERLVQEWGGRIESRTSTRLFRLDGLRPPQGVPGHPRLARSDDIELLAGWVEAFHDEADPGTPHSTLPPEVRREESRQNVRDRMTTDGQWVWEVEGDVVSCAATRPAAYGFARIGPVYAPPTRRGQGYAAGVTAAVSQAILDAGATPCLFTDIANPTSNGVYQRIGFVPVEDSVNLVVVDESQLSLAP